MPWRSTLFVLVVQLSFHANLMACSCARSGPAPCGKWDNSLVAFVGTVTDVENPATEKREDQAGVSRYHFRVDEELSGTSRKEVDVYSGRGGGDCSYHFKAGQTYLIFPYGNADNLWAAGCSETRPIGSAGALLPQLRAIRDGKKVASLYGTLYRIHQPSREDDSEGYVPLTNAKVTLRSRAKAFETTTDDHGVYKFYDLPAGSYQVGAVLPPNLVLEQETLDGPPGPLMLPAHSCYENDLEAEPTGRIRGQVLGPDGKRLECASVELFIANEYAEAKHGLWESQCGADHFEFSNISAGDYILVFNNSNQIKPDNLFLRSYFPGTPDLKKAEIIRLREGEQFLNAEIHLTEAIQLRELRVLFKTESGRLPPLNMVAGKGPQPSFPTSEQIVPGVLKVFLIASRDYELQGNGSCSINDWRVHTDSVRVSGSDNSVKEITLVYPDKPCD